MPYIFPSGCLRDYKWHCQLNCTFILRKHFVGTPLRFHCMMHIRFDTTDYIHRTHSIEVSESISIMCAVLLDRSYYQYITCDRPDFIFTRRRRQRLDTHECVLKHTARMYMLCRTRRNRTTCSHTLAPDTHKVCMRVNGRKGLKAVVVVVVSV